MNPTRRTLRTAGAAAVFGGAVFAGTLLVPSIASAQETDATEATAEDRQERREARRAAMLETLESIGLSSDALTAGKAAGQSLAEIAEAEGIGRADLVDGLVAAAETRLDEAVASGSLSEEEAAEKLATLADKIDDRVDREPRDRAVRAAERVSNLADALGVSVEELRAASAEGQTLAEIADSQGIAEADLVDALVADATERVTTAVDEGRIDADRADEKLAELTERVTERVNREPGERPERDGERRRGPGGRNGGGASADAGTGDA